MEDFSLKDKTILITGASSGIGRGCAVACSNHEANLILVARNQKNLQQTLSQLRSGTKVETILEDITNFEKLETLVAEKVEKIGKIAGFIHCAGIEKTIPIKRQNPQIFNEVFDINVLACFELAKILSSKKYKSEKSSFVFIASVAGIVGEVGKTLYSASKGAVISGAKSMAMELARSGIRVNSVSPAMVKTPIMDEMFESIGEEASAEIIKKHPLGTGSVEDVANTCVFLLSDASRWITGTNMVVDGGYSAQ